jgi:Tfp pilus assembly protein PilN
MKDIDFLPESYRQRRLQRRAHVWEIGTVALFGLIIAATASVQLTQRWRMASQIKDADADHRTALEVQKQLADLQSQLAQKTQVAELYSYLEHPWPRTQVLHAVSDCLDEGLSLTRLSIAREQGQYAAATGEAKEEELSPAQQDLKRLQAEYDQRSTVVTIAGTADDARQVHAFIDRLSASTLLKGVKLESVENQDQPEGRHTMFRLRGTLKPAYGQAGGPRRGPTTADALSQATPQEARP